MNNWGKERKPLSTRNKTHQKCYKLRNSRSENSVPISRNLYGSVFDNWRVTLYLYRTYINKCILFFWEPKITFRSFIVKILQKKKFEIFLKNIIWNEHWNSKQKSHLIQLFAQTWIHWKISIEIWIWPLLFRINEGRQR